MSDDAKPPVEFYFDFSSPYAYFASLRIDDVAKLYERSVVWKPIMLGVVFKTTGATPLLDQPLKGEYAKRDLARTTRLLGVDFRLPSSFPFAAIAPSRLFYWLAQDDAARARAYAKAVFSTAFQESVAVNSPDAAADVAAKLGIDRGAALAACNDPEIKEKLRLANEEAVAIGVCGAPYFIVEGEPFWGNDRLDHLERWLATGGW
ncbi:MAG: 2-hydroxychromene-2-carboxylate isomerase [Oceanibaculum nanhaiense]|uniref:2-hydroxychromene-2-carboxylate isomerase n=1 Tax=Oceanibaculum nanhaiense TaxID=1909734 RepID=UPI0025A4B08E|nr:2-hydroxychromene-2-carboxylate isomerase [Oceanibaculum nanhaiense]MDM7946125.1 2-hydroxychromene-2-carboxylate isomerase [Oceanibaculum nanhaiense]